MGGEGSATLFRFCSECVCERTVLGNPTLLEVMERASRVRPVIARDAGLVDFTDEVPEVKKRCDRRTFAVVQQHHIFPEDAEQNGPANVLKRYSLAAPLGSQPLVSR